MSKHRDTIHFDVDDEEALSAFSLGDEVTVRIRGTIKGMSSPRKNEFGLDDELEIFPGDVTVEIDERTIKKGRNVFSELDEDEES